jgi:hypothetical protein
MNNQRMQSADHDMPVTSLRSFIEDLENSIAVARTLVEAGHAIDLTGFDRLVGLLCAQVLDLPPEDAGLFKDDLSGLLASVDALSCSLAPGGPGIAA